MHISKRKRGLILLLVTSLITIGSSGNLIGAQYESNPEYWPTNGWRETTPEQQGVDSTKLAEALEYIRNNQINIHSLLVIRNGYVVLDASFFPYDGKTVHDVASVTKSVTSMLIGLAVEQGKIKSVRQRVLEIFPASPDAKYDPRKEKLTIEDLLTMSSGLECSPKENEITLRQMKESNDWLRFQLNLPMAYEPGQKFVYCSGGMHLLSGVVSRTTGSNALEFGDRSLFQLIGIEDVVWPSDPRGITHGWGDLHLHPRDMAKLGLLWLKHGSWDGRQILSSNWFNEATRTHVAAGTEVGYGYGLWIRPRAGLYEALGRGGQRISIVPEKNLIIVFTGGGFEPGEVAKFLVPAVVADKPLPENSVANARLKSAVATALLPPRAKPVAELPSSVGKITGKNYVFADNLIGLKSLSLTFPTRTEALIHFQFIDQRFSNLTDVRRSVGLDGVPRISAGGRFGLPVALKGMFENEETMVIDYDEVANINRYQLRLNFTHNGVLLQLSERTGTAKLSFEGKQK